MILKKLLTYHINNYANEYLGDELRVESEKFIYFIDAKQATFRDQITPYVGYLIRFKHRKNYRDLILAYDSSNEYRFITLNNIVKIGKKTYESYIDKRVSIKTSKSIFTEIKKSMKNFIINDIDYSSKETISSELQKHYISIYLDYMIKKVANPNILEKEYKNVFEEGKKPKFTKDIAKTTKVTKKYTNPIEKFIDKYAFGHRQVMLFGEKGTGKTYNIKNVCENNDWELITISGHFGLDEYSLLGHLIRLKNGSFDWKNGRLAKAFRMASQGKKVVVFIDEILRMNPQTLNLLVTTMDPYKGNYELELDNPTQSSDEYVDTEILRVSTKNLWFIAATNIGANYEVSNIDEALKDRFIMKQMTLSNDQMKSIIKQKLEDKDLHINIDVIMEFYEKIHLLFEQELISHDINLRHIMDVLEYAEFIRDLKELFEDKMLAWVGLDYTGEPIKKEVELVHKLIEKYF